MKTIRWHTRIKPNTTGNWRNGGSLSGDGAAPAPGRSAVFMGRMSKCMVNGHPLATALRPPRGGGPHGDPHPPRLQGPLAEGPPPPRPQDRPGGPPSHPRPLVYRPRVSMFTASVLRLVHFCIVLCSHLCFADGPKKIKAKPHMNGLQPDFPLIARSSSLHQGTPAPYGQEGHVMKGLQIFRTGRGP